MTLLATRARRRLGEAPLSAGLADETKRRDTYLVAFDISHDASPRPLADPETSFDEFYELNIVRLGRATELACADADLATTVLTGALVKTSQRWRQLDSHTNRVGFTLYAALAEADHVLRDRPPLAMNEATGGYLRGLNLPDALATLPLHQRAALVVAYFLMWSDDKAAAGAGIDVETVTTRRTRGLSHLAHHLRVTSDEIEPLLVEHFAGTQPIEGLAIPASPDVARRGRRRTMRNRVAAGALLVVVIAIGGAIFQAGTAPAPVARGPQPVSPPANSATWFSAVSDGDGGFVALDATGGSRFIHSADGDVWFESARWNSRAIDLRTAITSFDRSGGRYITTIEAPPAFRSFVPPHIAIADDLDNWQVRRMEVAAPPEVAGLRIRYHVLSATAANDLQLVALRVEETLDYRFHGVNPDDVCAESRDTSELTFFLCDGEAVTVDRPDMGSEQADLFFLAEGTAPFVQVDLPPASDPRSLVSTGSGFAVVDAVTGAVSISGDGRMWESLAGVVDTNRQVLIEGDAAGAALVVVPDAAGWTSHLIQNDGTQTSGVLPVDLDPAAVWTPPDLAVGPAGWALFLTTSRPWERSDVSPGWAVDTGEWIVSRQPDAALITARSVDGSETFRFLASSPLVRSGADETIVLMRPGSETDLVRVTSDMIDRSRAAEQQQDAAKAFVFFSRDGVRWQPIWQGEQDAWFGSLAVGDAEILLSGSALTGAPIRIPIPD